MSELSYGYPKIPNIEVFEPHKVAEFVLDDSIAYGQWNAPSPYVLLVKRLQLQASRLTSSNSAATARDLLVYTRAVA